MGGEQAASVLATVRRDGMEAKGETLAGRRGRGLQAADPRPVTRREGHPYYATARLWDDGIIDPGRHAHVLGAGAVGCAERADRPRPSSASSGCDGAMTDTVLTTIENGVATLRLTVPMP